ncbi:hypothetical protein AB0F81_35435 [Actinoplanes sp. NPDC024001]|uniref:hypothetical protein n=1 Tax=Actinoplanes sp. NPDC024001 TaxID=3154598 RepID=UPI0033C7B4F3
MRLLALLLVATGASITDSAAAVLHRLSPAERDRAMRSLFDPRTGIGVSFLRQPIGSSDFTAAAEHYSLTIKHDRAQILPLPRQAKRLNPTSRSWVRRGARPRG